MNPSDLSLQSPDYGLLPAADRVRPGARSCDRSTPLCRKRGIITVLTGVSLVGYAAAMVALYWQDGKNESTFKGLLPGGWADGLPVVIILDRSRSSRS